MENKVGYEIYWECTNIAWCDCGINGYVVKTKRGDYDAWVHHDIANDTENGKKAIFDTMEEAVKVAEIVEQESDMRIDCKVWEVD